MAVPFYVKHWEFKHNLFDKDEDLVFPLALFGIVLPAVWGGIFSLISLWFLLVFLVPLSIIGPWLIGIAYYHQKPDYHSFNSNKIKDKYRDLPKKHKKKLLPLAKDYNKIWISERPDLNKFEEFVNELSSISSSVEQGKHSDLISEISSYIDFSKEEAEIASYAMKQIEELNRKRGIK